MAIIPLPYGTGHIRLDTRNHPHLTVLQAGHPMVLADPLAAVRSALSAPAGTLPLAELIRQKQPGKIVVVVNDETRPTPYEAFFPPLLEVFAQCGIRDEQVTFLALKIAVSSFKLKFAETHAVRIRVRFFLRSARQGRCLRIRARIDVED